MDTRLLRMFCAVAEAGSLVAASRRLHLTPSAISHGLKGLETQLGCRLFERVGKRMLLNQAGEQLLNQIEKPLAALDAAEASLKQLARWGHTRLRIGAAASACQYIIPPVVRELKKQFPKLTLQVRSGDMGEMMGLIEKNEIDLALGVVSEESPSLESRPVFRDELLFTFSSSHPWSSGKPISADELRIQPLILYQASSLTARLVDDYFRKLQIVPSTIMEVGNIEAIKALVKLNLGVAVLAPWTAEKELMEGSLLMRPLGPRPLHRRWAVGTLSGRRLSLAEESFIRICRTVAAGLRVDRKDLPRPGKRKA